MVKSEADSLTHLFTGGPPVPLRVQPYGIGNLITLHLVKDAPGLVIFWQSIQNIREMKLQKVLC